jgi:hypothetical protein
MFRFVYSGLKAGLDSLEGGNFGESGSAYFFPSDAPWHERKTINRGCKESIP